MEKTPLIVGFDPGTTIGLAILCTNGKILHTFSEKNISHAQIISKIINKGSAVILATDKQKCPKAVQDIATKLGSVIHTPTQDLSKKEKQLLTQNFKGNDHQRDALAAALHTFNFYKLRLQKIHDFIRTHNLTKHQTRFTKLAIQSQLHFSLIKKLLTKKDEPTKIITNQ